MNITPSALDAIYYTFDGLFQGAFDRTPTWYEQIASVMPSSTKSQRHYWMALIPRLREWLGERVLNNVQARSQEVINKDWELSIEVDRNNIEDDQLGVFTPTLQMMGEQAKKWPDDVLVSLLQASTSTLCFDGQNFFDSSHPVKLGDTSLSTYSNNNTATQLNAANYGTVRAAMMAYKGEDGKPLRVMPNLLIVPPQLEQAGRQILNADFIAPAAAVGMNAASVMQTNTMKGSANLLVIPELANEATTWYLADCAKSVKPYIWQLRKAPQLISLTAPETANVFYRRKYVYGLDSRGNAGLGLPFLISRCIA